MAARTEHDEILRRFPTVESVSRRPGPGRIDHVARRIGILLLLGVVVVGCLGYLGPRSESASATGPAGDLELEYDSLTRPGLDTEFTVTVTPGEPSETLRLVVDQATLARLGIEQFSPEPVEQRTVADRVVLDFATASGPEGEFEVRFSGRIPTTQMPGRHRWTVEWHPAAGASVPVDATTWTVP